ncbi:MAG: hypothetical protein E7473_01095 [Ruminococcaceae bacterium]|nr:hypothetical protein [Oscillospiraceae bacterium]
MIPALAEAARNIKSVAVQTNKRPSYGEYDMKIKRRILALTLAFAIVTSALPISSAASFSYTDMSEHLTVEKYEITEVAPETSYLSLTASNASGKQVINAVAFNPQNPYTQLRAGKSQGYVWSTQTVNTIANNMSNVSGGDVAVAGINGDFFTFGVGVPHGIFIEDGIILSTPPQYYAAFGITYDNKPFITRHGSILDELLLVNGSYVNIAGINMTHAEDSESIMLYTADYARGTKTGTDTYEIRCRVNSGEVRHGGTVNFTVEEINSGKGDTTLGTGYIVFSARGASSIATLKQLTVGSTHEISFRFNKFWSNVKFAVGGIELLLKDGKVYSTTDKSRNPRTSIGIRADGTVVMATFDGRDAGGAKGMTYKTAAEGMLALGCVDALNLDGGGSTTFVLRTPGAMETKIVNNVSGSSARQVANALILMNTAPSTNPTTLSVSPQTRLCFVGGKYKFSVTGAYDANYKPYAVPTNLVWGTNSEGNTMSADGILSADVAGKITVSASGNGGTGTASVEIVDRADAISVSESKLSVKRGETFELSASASLGGKKIEAPAEVFLWQAPASLGEFTSPGKFKVSDNAVSGEITVSIGGKSTKVSVDVDMPPVTITGFEDNSVIFTPVSVGTKIAPGVAIESILKYAHTGERSLKTYYNFHNTTGSVASYYMVANSSKNPSAFHIKIAPKQIAMMVYGDGSGIELRSILEDASGKQHTISYGKINHTGWKYMTATLPSGISGEVYLKVPVYLVSNPSKRTAGALYFDGLTAIYTEKNLDTTSPVVTKTWPLDGQKIDSPTPTIGIILSDSSGIDEKSIQLYIDGVLCENPTFDATNTRVSHTVSEALSSGAHSVMLFARDKVGNPVFHKFGFEV